MLKPWEQLAEEPPGLTPSDVVFTAWIETSCQQDPTLVRCDFQWFTAEGNLAETVDSGPVSAWEPSGAESPAAEPREAKGPMRFEKSSQPVKSTCAFVRKLTLLSLRVRIRFSVAGSAVRTEASPTPKAKAKAKGKSKVAEEPQVVVDLPDEVVTKEMSVQLAHLVVTGEVSQAAPATVLNGQLDYLKIGVRCSPSVMSEDVASYLNPLLITLESTRQLPKEPHLGQAQSGVYAVLDAFGQRYASEVSSLGPRGCVQFGMLKTFFTGAWHQRQLREFLQTERITVEIRDRDPEPPPKPPSMPSSPAPSPTPPTTRRKSIKRAETRRESEQAATLVEEPPPAPPVPAPTSAHGIASFSLGELLGPVRSLQLRAELEPRGAPRAPRSGREPLQVETLLEGSGQLQRGQAAAREQIPGYLESGAFVKLSVRLARPIRGGPSAGDAQGSHERFSRAVVVADYGKVTLLRRLCALVSKANVAALQLDPTRVWDQESLDFVELSEEQRSDTNLDLLTGFVVIDRSSRIAVIEGLRDGAMKQVTELAKSAQRSVRCKVLVNRDVGWSQRLYGDFGASLKQLKLRAPTLASLAQKPDLCLPGRADVEAAEGVHTLMGLRLAERLHVLKRAGAFPSAAALSTIATHYGEYVSHEERECRTSSKISRKVEEVGPAVVDSDSDDSSLPQHESPLRSRLVMKRALDNWNKDFALSLTERALQPAPNIEEANKAFLHDLSCENAKVNATSRKVGPRKNVDTSFLEGKPVHIYSGQKLNSAELQKEALRVSMREEETHKFWTYAGEHNSCAFPVHGQDTEPASKAQSGENTSRTPREPFRYPKQKQKEDFLKLDLDVSETRKDDLKSPWIENQLYPELQPPEVVRGAFDAKSLGTGGNHVIPQRRPGLHPPGIRTPPPEREPLQPPLRLSAKAVVGSESLMDKYNSSILHERPQARGLRFQDRTVPRRIRHKFGPGTALKEVEVPPISLNLTERYEEAQGNSTSLNSFMRDVARPAESARTASASRTMVAAATARGLQLPLSAREDGAETRRYLMRFGGSQAWSAGVASAR